jgi:hypothetical protein
LILACFGGLDWRLDPADARAAACLWDAYHGYIPCDDTPELPSVSCRVMTSSARDCALDPVLRVFRAGAHCFVERGDFLGEIDLDRRRILVECHAAIPSLHAFFRVANALLLAKLDGLLLHASSIVRGGRAYLFAGPSGAGKTTIARLSGGRVLSDEVSAVRRIGRTFHCYSTPFFGEYDGAPGSTESAPLERVCFPARATYNALAPTTAAQAAQQIVRSVYRHGADATLASRMFHTSSELASAVPCGWLEFRPEPQFWSVLDG